MIKVLISGTSRGFGKHLKSEFGRAGYEVLSLNRNCSNEEVNCFSGDLFAPGVAEEVIREVTTLHPDISTVVLNAGVVGPIKPTREVTRFDMREAFEVNFFSGKDVIDYLLKHTAVSTFVYIGSGAAFNVYGGWATYGLTKLMMFRLFDYYRIEEPEKRFLSINPGPMLTEMNKIIRSEASDELEWKQKFQDERNLNHPSDMARILVELLSSQSRLNADSVIDLRTYRL